MKKSILLAIPMCAGLVFSQSTGQTGTGSTGSGTNTGQSGSAAGSGQTGDTQSSGQTPTRTQDQPGAMGSGSGQTISGILVASECNSSTMQGAWNLSHSGGSQPGSMSSTTGSGSSATSGTAGQSGTAPASNTTGTAGSTSGTTGSTAGSGEATRSNDRTDNRSASLSNTNTSGTTGSTTGSTSTSSTTGSTSGSGTDMARSTASAGASGQSGTPGQTGAGASGRSTNTPDTGMADRNRGSDMGAWSGQWDPSSQGAGGWDRSCFIGPSTSSFVLLTKDGRQLKLHEESNSMVRQRLTGRVSDKSKIFRVRANGNMTGDTLQLTDIQM